MISGQMANDTVYDALKQFKNRRRGTSDPRLIRRVLVHDLNKGGHLSAQTTGALKNYVALDPHTGALLAMVGGTDFAESQFNRALQARRQPGSAFKPIVYAAALSGGKTVVSMTDDSPIEFDRNEEELWKPRNYDGTFLGPIPLIEAWASTPRSRETSPSPWAPQG